MIKNIKLQNIHNIIRILKSMEPKNCIQNKIENVHSNVSYDFSKFEGSKKIKV